MKKILLGVLGVCLLILLILTISADNSNNTSNSTSVNNTNPKQLLLKCKAECGADKKISHQNCIDIHANISKEIRQDYKMCLDDAKQEFKNKTVNNTNVKNASKELASNIKNCTNNYLKGLKEADNKRRECFKISDINCEKKCQNEICLTSYQPVCGVDNKTYSNECQLKNASVKKACDGQCPCLVCNNYYWFDNQTKVCSKKEFCGTFMYQGLNVFNKKEDCNAALKNLSVNNPICGNGKCENGEDISCPRDCIKNGQCLNNSDCKQDEFCKKQNCSSEQGKCTKVPQMCNMLYSPVCGCDGKTYSSDCVLNSFKVNKKTDGICFQCSSDADCPQIMCFKAPCPQNVCVDNTCKLIEAHTNCINGSQNC